MGNYFYRIRVGIYLFGIFTIEKSELPLIIFTSRHCLPLAIYIFFVHPVFYLPRAHVLHLSSLFPLKPPTPHPLLYHPLLLRRRAPTHPSSFQSVCPPPTQPHCSPWPSNIIRSTRCLPVRKCVLLIPISVLVALRSGCPRPRRCRIWLPGPRRPNQYRFDPVVQVEHREHGGDGSIGDYRSQSDLSEEQQYKAFELRHIKLQEYGGLLR